MKSLRNLKMVKVLNSIAYVATFMLIGLQIYMKLNVNFNSYRGSEIGHQGLIFFLVILASTISSITFLTTAFIAASIFRIELYILNNTNNINNEKYTTDVGRLKKQERLIFLNCLIYIIIKCIL